MSKVLFSGDPRIFINDNGASLTFKGGQPVLDAGLENAVIISLFTKPGYWGNLLRDNDTEQIGSDFEETAALPVSVSNMRKLQRVTEKALEWLKSARVASDVEVTISNPSQSYINVAVLVTPYGSTPTEILLAKSGKNWIFQADNPA